MFRGTFGADCNRSRVGLDPVLVMHSRFVARRCMAIIVLVVCHMIACAGPERSSVVNYSDTPGQNFDKAEKKFEAKNWLAARKYYAFVKSEFPYSKYAVLAELRLADVAFSAERFLAAADKYKLFVRLHPSHEKVKSGYASFRIVESYTKTLPGDVWILPPSYEKDHSASLDAIRHCKAFLESYPKSRYHKKAEQILKELHLRMAKHEWYVARYYWKQGKAMGTVLRLRRLLDRYSGVGLDGDALWLLGQAYVKVKMPDRAKRAWKRLVTEYPHHGKANDAQRALKRI